MKPGTKIKLIIQCQGQRMAVTLYHRSYSLNDEGLFWVCPAFGGLVGMGRSIEEAMIDFVHKVEADGWKSCEWYTRKLLLAA